MTKTADPPSDPFVGKVLGGRYRLETLLGGGTVGRVYAAEHVMMKKPLAVKILHAEHAKNPEVVARFEREATAAANIEHPNVVAAMDFGKLEDGTVYLALELVQGKNLRAEIARGPFSVQRALHVARQIALGLAAAHARNIVHRDLRPENVVLVEKDGDPDFVKILDFGVAKLTDDSSPLTKVGVVLGTMDYMAPEQALGKTVDGRADLYALGAVLYEMLSGARPYEGESASAILQLQLTKPAPSLAERAPALGIPKAVDALVTKLLAREPKDRPAFAAAVATQLAELAGSASPDAAAAGSAVAAKPAPAAPPRPNRPTFLPTDPLPQFTFPPTVEESKKLTAEVQAALAAQAAAPQAAAPPVAPVAPGPPASPPAPVAPPASVGLPAPVVPQVPFTPERLAEFGDVARPPEQAKPALGAPEIPRSLEKRATGAAAIMDVAAGWVDDNLRYLPRIIRRPLRRVPSRVLAGVLLGLVVVLVLVLVLWLV